MSHYEGLTPTDATIAMLAECPTFRAIVAYPSATMEELRTILLSGSVAEGEAADRIVYGDLTDDPNASDYLEKPRAAVDQSEQTLTRTSTTGFDDTGAVGVIVQTAIPESLLTNRNGARRDADYKLAWLIRDMKDQAAQYPRLMVTDISGVHGPGLGRLSDPKMHSKPGTEQFMILDFEVRYR